MDIKEFIDKWGTEGPGLLLSFSNRTTTCVDGQEEIDRLVKDLTNALREEAKRLMAELPKQ